MYVASVLGTLVLSGVVLYLFRQQIDHVDEALYQAKADGRNQVVYRAYGSPQAGEPLH